MSRRGGLSQLGPALRWLRKRRGTKQHEVAERAGITRPMLSAYERGRVRPTVETLERILTAMGCGLGQLAEALKLVAAEIPPAVAEQPRIGPAGEPQAFRALKRSAFAWLEALREEMLRRGRNAGE